MFQHQFEEISEQAVACFFRHSFKHQSFYRAFHCVPVCLHKKPCVVYPFTLIFSFSLRLMYQSRFNFRAFIIRLACVHVQTIVRSCPDHRASMSRPSCVHVQTIVRSCPDHRAFMSRPSCVHVQTIVRSCPHHRAFMSRPSCVHVQTIVRSCPDHRAFMSRPSCVHVQTFVRSPGMVWTYCLRTHEERTKGFERPIVWTYPLSVWDGLDIGTLSLGRSGHIHFGSGTSASVGSSVERFTFIGRVVKK